MAKFCTKCGRPLQEGEICNCDQASKQQKDGINIQLNINPDTISDAWGNMKARTGMGVPEDNMSSAFEEGMRIVPECINANEGEVPVRQYTIAELRNKILGITYAKALGKIQVTNKRVIFRAPGRCITGRTTLQQEFVIDEIGGVEARREYIFNMGDIFLGILATVFSLICMLAILIKPTIKNPSLGIVLSLIFGIAALVPFFVVKKKWLLKLFCEGISMGAFFLPIVLDKEFFYILLLFAFILWLVSLFFHAIKPNLVLVVKAKGATSSAINIRRGGGMKRLIKRSSDAEQDNHTGFSEILPIKDTEKCIRELGAVINDIQKMGDYAVEKWKE